MNSINNDNSNSQTKIQTTLKTGANELSKIIKNNIDYMNLISKLLNKKTPKGEILIDYVNIDYKQLLDQVQKMISLHFPKDKTFLIQMRYGNQMLSFDIKNFSQQFQNVVQRFQSISQQIQSQYEQNIITKNAYVKYLLKYKQLEMEILLTLLTQTTKTISQRTKSSIEKYNTSNVQKIQSTLQNQTQTDKIALGLKQIQDKLTQQASNSQTGIVYEYIVLPQQFTKLTKKTTQFLNELQQNKIK